MIVFAIIGIICVAIVIAAFRIILGWILPRPALAKFDAAAAATFRLFAKLSIVVFAGMIIFAIVSFARS